MPKNHLIKIIILVIIVGGLGFFAGIQYQKTQRASLRNNFQNNGTMRQWGTGRQGNGAMRMTPVSGEITKVDDNTIIIKTSDGGSKIVVYSTSTKVDKTSEGSKSDLKVGEKVMVVGSASSDGTVTAQNISVGNIMLQRGVPPTGNQ
jgi:hypothetical protein